MTTIKAKIRKIILGNNPKEDGIAFQAGNKAGRDGHIISEIIEDTNYFFSVGSVRFLVFIKHPSEQNSFLWKSFINVPASIEYFLPTDEYENIV